MSGRPYPKHHQLKHVRLKVRRKIATQDEWADMRAEKRGVCRCCGAGGHCHLHHIVPRSKNGGDVTDNLIPLCWACHELVHKRDRMACLRLVFNLRDDEYAYAVTKCGEPVWERVYGIVYTR